MGFLWAVTTKKNRLNTARTSHFRSDSESFSATPRSAIRKAAAASSGRNRRFHRTVATAGFEFGRGRRDPTRRANGELAPLGGHSSNSVACTGVRHGRGPRLFQYFCEPAGRARHCVLVTVRTRRNSTSGTELGAMSPPTGVSLRLSNFIGRKKEMGELRRLLAHTRLLTMLGPGGAGKTRLATEFARAQAHRFADGQITIELVEVRDPALVPDAFARAAGIRLQAEDAVATLVHRLSSSEMLLVVDNCEHLTEAAAAVVARLLTACPRLVVLATSRERLNLDGEVLWRVPPLALPHTADTFAIVSVAEAVRLFVDRARNVSPGFDIKPDNVAAIVAICRRLDGMPLAIELAAARASGLSPAEIMARLDDRLRLLTGGPRDADARHRTLRAAMDWSYQLLDPAERTLLQRFSIFAGPVL